MVEKHKIVLLGDGGVGKSCITIQFCLKQFMPDYDPTIENIYRKPLTIDGRITMLEILDTAGTFLQSESLYQKCYLK
jgi:small GTP-binding protein